MAENGRPRLPEDAVESNTIKSQDPTVPGEIRYALVGAVVVGGNTTNDAHIPGAVFDWSSKMAQLIDKDCLGRSTALGAMLTDMVLLLVKTQLTGVPKRETFVDGKTKVQGTTPCLENTVTARSKLTMIDVPSDAIRPRTLPGGGLVTFTTAVDIFIKNSGSTAKLCTNTELGSLASVISDEANVDANGAATFRVGSGAMFIVASTLPEVTDCTEIRSGAAPMPDAILVISEAWKVGELAVDNVVCNFMVTAAERVT